MIIAALTFHPHQVNPRRASGFGVWRVAFCKAPTKRIKPYVETLLDGTKVMKMNVPRMFKRHSRVDPKNWIGR